MMDTTQITQLSKVDLAMDAEVRHIGGLPTFRKRMLSLGLTPGSHLTVLRQMPAGGPIEIQVRGTRLAIRRSDAAKIDVYMPEVGSCPTEIVQDGRQLNHESRTCGQP